MGLAAMGGGFDRWFIEAVDVLSVDGEEVSSLTEDEMLPRSEEDAAAACELDTELLLWMWSADWSPLSECLT